MTKRSVIILFLSFFICVIIMCILYTEYTHLMMLRVVELSVISIVIVYNEWTYNMLRDIGHDQSHYCVCHIISIVVLCVVYTEYIYNKYAERC